MSKGAPNAKAEEHLRRLRRICMSLPETTEKLSHGEPTFFRKKVYAMFDNNHHNDGHIAVWVPAAPGVQEMVISTWPKKFFRPPYVGVSGWIGIELDNVDDEELTTYLHGAWQLVGVKKKPRQRNLWVTDASNGARKVRSRRPATQLPVGRRPFS